MRDIKPGDKVWIPRFHPLSEERVVCPVCFGKKTLKVIFGDDSVVRVRCRYCDDLHMGPRGWVIEQRPVARAELVEISAVTMGTDGVEEVRALGVFWQRGGDKLDVFDSEDAALSRAKEMAEEYQKEQDQKELMVKEDVNYTWRAGHHLHQAKRKHAEAERHEKLAAICKDRSKGG